MISHQSLIKDIKNFSPMKNEVGYWWLGQHSFILKTISKIIYLDPFLSEHPKRLVKPLLGAEEVAENADLILGSHDHIDHIDRKVWKDIIKHSKAVHFIVPELLKNNLKKELNIPDTQIIGCDDNKTIELDSVKVTGIAAAHEFLDQDIKTKQYPYLGYILELDDMVIYHSGDTCLYEGMITKLKNWDIDIAFLPINGRDAVRLSSGCIGNITYQEAADLSGCISPYLTIPGHYGMFAKNTINPELFYDYMEVKYPELEVNICTPGARNTYIKGQK